MKHTVAVEVPNALGMHARPSAEFVKLAGTFSSAITVARDDLSVNAKSIMGVLMLAAEPWSRRASGGRGSGRSGEERLR